ncbi:MAG: aldehyde dehydrogenase family protein, partial [Pseudomonadota bacterium]
PDWVPGRAKPNFKHLTDYVPYALVGVISPWNFPITLSFIDAVQALMAGSCVLIKPSEVTPRFADALAPVIADADLSDIIAFTQGDGATGAAIMPNVDCVCFTGSVATGRKVAVAAAENLIPANLELGGKDPMIVTASADMDKATTLALRASVLATGQACQSIERIYAPRNDYDSFVAQLTDKAKDISLNFPDISLGDIGPFIFSKQADIVAGQIEDAKAKGATVLTGGVVERHGGGFWMAPTVIRDVTHAMDIMREETFGPVIPVMAYDTVGEAIALTNDTAFGLSGAVFAGSIEEAHEIGQHIEAGAISLMDGALTGQYFEAPKQSFKASGLGGSRMGADGFRRFFRQKSYIANTVCPLTIQDFSENA